MLLGLGAIVPFCIFSGISFVVILHQQKIQVEESTIGMARALAGILDASMQRTVAALETFALAQSLGEPGLENLPAAHAAARLIREARPDWRGVVLAKPDGSVVFGSESPFGSGMRQVMEAASVAEVVRTRAPIVGPMTAGPRGNIGYTVRIPVLQRGELKYILTAILSSDSILELIRQQQMPAHWLVSVFDSDMKRVARSKDHERYFNSPPSPTMRKMLEELGDKEEAIGTAVTMEGEHAYTAISRIENTGWSIAMATSSEIAHAAVGRTAWLYGTGLLISLVLGGVTFWLLSCSITTRARALRESAIALGFGITLPVPPKGLSEFDEVSLALWEAGQRHAQTESDRDMLLRSEVEARATAEQARGRMQMLLAATSSLSQSLDEGRALNAMASVIVPRLADILRIDLLDADGLPDRQLTFHRDPSRVDEIDQIFRSGAPLAVTPGSLPWVIASGREYVHHFHPEEVQEIQDPIFRRFVESTGMTAMCAAPIIARDRIIGAMAIIQSSSGRRFETEDVSLFSDVAKRVALALDNMRLYSECTCALEKAKLASKVKDEFLAMLGHELRNPLAPILNVLEIMERRDAEAFVKERQIIERQAKHMAYLVDDLLDASRIAAGKLQLQLEVVDLRGVIQRAIELSEPLFAQRLAPTVCGEAEPIYVRGDFVRLAQVVSNLLSNAAKFSEPDQPVVVELMLDADRAVLVVADQGHGISNELMPRVFDSFVQSTQSMQRSSGGLGLGLTISRSIVNLHGGTIEAQPGEGGRGTRLVVSLPLLAGPEKQEEGSSGPVGHGSRLRVLVVDDSADAAQSLADILELSGHEVATAGDADECLDVIGVFCPDVCILDIGLPGMNGYDLARRLRSSDSTRSLRLIALTGYAQYSDREKAIAAGFDEHLAKPASFESLMAALESK